jgi:hypothetical protein
MNAYQRNVRMRLQGRSGYQLQSMNKSFDHAPFIRNLLAIITIFGLMNGKKLILPDNLLSLFTTHQYWRLFRTVMDRILDS